ncbi:MAG: hypothetical protein KA250_12890 [Verrucomicrobiales bacterium]|jgi:hypothetical protein|nr:hypothetical protein [Verrucomicrobiales bacterium]MBP9224938.1 hypothetical protein [Verrucomicrobiales bacterium]
MIKKFFQWIAGSDPVSDTPIQIGGIFERMSPEGVCGINPAKMDRDQIRAHLAMLYKRHNNAASSLDADLRKEAEQMLDAIVHCREKYIETEY